MRKKKFDMSKYADMHEEKDVIGKDGKTIVVRNHISYADKNQMATDMAEHLIMIHEDSCVYLSYAYDKYEKYMIAKYYTNINTDGIEEDVVADFMINNELINDVISYIVDDLEVVRRMYDDIVDAVTTTFTDDRCLTKAIRTSFGFLFTGEDVTENLAKAEATSGVIMNAMNALRREDKAQEGKVNKGQLSVGGNIINFAKKE